jgi:hypothetical protein
LGDWETFHGVCTYPQSSTWSITGKEERISDWIANKGTTQDSETFVRRYESKTFAKKSVGAEIGFSFAKWIFGGSVGGSFSYEWGWENASAFERRSEKTIPPCSAIALTWKPYQRVVRVNPVFHVWEYRWDKGHGDKATVNTWRGRGPGWERIYSYGYYIDGTSDKLLKGADGTYKPDGEEAKIQRALDPRECAHDDHDDDLT